MNQKTEGDPRDNFDEDVAEVLQGEILEPIAGTALAVMHKAEIDQQVATAKRFPRDLKEVKATVMTLATLDEETAEACIYALPRGKKAIKGASARFAEMLFSTWGNCRSDSFISEVNREEKYVEAVGVFIDVERNTARRKRTRRRISNSDGGLYNADMILMTQNAACSIAERNATLGGIPKMVWGEAYDRAHAMVAGTVQTLTDKRTKALKAFALYGVTPEQVFAVMKIRNEEQINVEDIPTIRGMLSALKSGEETVESLFGRSPGGSNHTVVKNPLKDDADEGPKTVVVDRKSDVRGATKAEQEADVVVDGKTGEVLKDRDMRDGSGPRGEPPDDNSERDTGTQKPVETPKEVKDAKPAKAASKVETADPLDAIKTPAQYLEHALAWITAGTDPEAMAAQKTRERTKRTQVGVMEDDLVTFNREFSARIKALQKAAG